MSKKKTLTFVTKNKEKISDIKEMLEEKIDLFFTDDLDLLEIQTLSVEKVVAFKAQQAFERIGTPVAVSDSGLEIKSLKGFPGALVKYVNETIGQEGLVKLLEDKKIRDASFVAAIGYFDANEGIKVFVKKDEGTISNAPKGKGWHFDRIFIPKGETRTWAEIGRNEKNRNSAFRRALEELAEFLVK
ncbi:MAG: non-canonical purine NTP pyrophosphatase [Asgard group archaeon]|nr:non-canonical purine NTP pyrophosphatase [Asgard group archaeon]